MCKGKCNTFNRCPQEALHRRRERGEHTEPVLTQILQSTETECDKIIINENEGQRVTFWSLFGGQFTNLIEGEKKRDRLVVGW